MTQLTSGIRSVLSNPAVYDFLQNIMGAHKVRQELVNDFIRPGNKCRILDLGCGTAEVLRYMPNTVEYWGYDISPDYISAAKAAYGTRGNFHCGLLTEADLNSLPKFDLVLALGVLHHLEDDLAKELCTLASQALNTAGRLVTIDPCLVSRQNPIARFLILRDRGQNVRSAQHYAALAMGSFKNVEGSLRHRVFVPYTHWIMECSN